MSTDRIVELLALTARDLGRPLNEHEIVVTAAELGQHDRATGRMPRKMEVVQSIYGWTEYDAYRHAYEGRNG